ncbi:MAG: ATP-binding cassette domain-containing protein [Candidatus Cohnella colombiensis]|uniref:ATP-binding cassette domain-containing protein n=1 Tax=Candidatus Cohnella colombiensis TaxID=3121368 RepID=A0AA95JFP4_9BACL|nr:MAG: ATP-binding cassette domain-containing protein [Cohnella sp.]
MSELVINVKGLRKTFKKIKKLEGFLSSVRSLWNREVELIDGINGIDLQVKKGEIRGLIGPNGAGKSTTIKIMSGILHPSEGTVNVLGFTPWKDRERFVRNLGVLFGQKSQLWWDLPPIDTFSLNKEMYKIPDDEYKRRLDSFLDMLQIRDVIHQPVRTLSLGERMKCELVCALLHHPPLIFLDEPTIGLDIVSKETVRQFIKQMNRELGTTFIITTHDLADLENLCDQVTIINKGTIVFDESMDKLSTFFSNSKIIDVKFAQPIDPSLFSAYTVVSSAPLSVQIEVDLTAKDIKVWIYEILEQFPVVDINITNIPIEDVIRHIYES